MKCAICAIAKMENDYIREFVEYHLALGYDNILLNDNNDIDGEQFEEVIGDYINSGIVVVIDRRGESIIQNRSYIETYNMFQSKFDWISMIDIDEYMTLANHSNIKDFLSQEIFDDFNAIQFNWMCYGDNDIIRREDGSVISRFTQPLPFEFCENCVTKCTLRCGLQDILFRNPHTAQATNIRLCSASGHPLAIGSVTTATPDFDNAYLRHYITKSLEEFINNKFRRATDACKKRSNGRRRFCFEYFWRYNTKSSQKISFIKEYLTFKEYWGNYYIEMTNPIIRWKSHKVEIIREFFREKRGGN